MTDEALMRAFRDGDVSSLGILFDRHHARLFDFLSRATGDRVAAEDLVQDVFVRMLKYRATYRDQGRFETWMYRIARNARADYFKGREPTEPLGTQALSRMEPSAGPFAQLEAARDRVRLKQALMALRSEQREVIVLARFLGFSHERIAEIFDIDVGAAKVRLHRALHALRVIWNTTTIAS